MCPTTVSSSIHMMNNLNELTVASEIFGIFSLWKVSFRQSEYDLSRQKKCVADENLRTTAEFRYSAQFGH